MRLYTICAYKFYHPPTKIFWIRHWCTFARIFIDGRRLHIGPPRRGAGKTMTSEPMDFRGPNRGAMGFSGPIKGLMGLKGPMRGANELHRAHRNEKSKTIFFFLKSLENPEKIVPFRLKDLFFIFGNHMKIRRKLCHFPCLFLIALNRRCVIFELSPGPPLALGAPGCTQNKLYQ